MLPEVAKACRGCLDALLAQANLVQDFLEPVPDSIPGYSKAIKNPADLGTVGRKLDEGSFPTAFAFFN